jgi:hypothetical protein
MPRKIAVVEWVDASWDSASVRPNEIEPLARMVECGWLVHQDKESVTLAAEVSDSDQTMRHTVHIPRSGIVRMQVVAVWDGAKKRKKK